MPNDTSISDRKLVVIVFETDHTAEELHEALCKVIHEGDRTLIDSKAVEDIVCFKAIV